MNFASQTNRKRKRPVNFDAKHDKKQTKKKVNFFGKNSNKSKRNKWSLNSSKI